LALRHKYQIYHSDGTYLAKVRGNRVYPTEAGKKVNIEIRDTPGKFICSLENKVIFELSHGVGEEFKADAELYAPDGRFVKCFDSPKPELFDAKGNAIKVGGITMVGNVFQNLLCRYLVTQGWFLCDRSILIQLFGKKGKIARHRPTRHFSGLATRRRFFV